MSRYNQYGNNNYYDPVGSQPAQPTGYSYQATGSTSSYQNAANSSAYGASTYQSYGSSGYGNQQYGNTGQQSSDSTSHAAAALSSLSNNHNYGQTSSGSSSNDRYNTSTSNPYNNMPSRNETQSPLYSSTQSSSTFGRMSIPEQSQTTSNTFGSTQPMYSNAPSSASMRSSSYHTAYTQQQQQQQQQTQPPRYNSPLHAVQAQQHGHEQQVSHSSNHLPSPPMASTNQQNKQASSSLEPSTTVDPSQVYDNRAELQRKAQMEAEKRRKYDAEQTARNAEEARVAEGARKREEEEQQRKKEEEAAVKKAAEQKQKNEQRRKAREDKKQSKNAATALQRLSSGNADAPGSSSAAAAPAAAPAANDEEAEMRAMFQKMREFNARNPAMLAKLWEEERTSHEATKSTPAPAPAPAAPAAKASAPPPKAANKTTRPAFQAPAPPAAATTTAPSTGVATTSLWPPHKKGALADVTAKWLTGLPPNQGKTILSDNVRQILDSNPSYVQLCESLEALGMSFDRSSLARELLKAVPDGMKSGSTPAAALAKRPNSSARPNETYASPNSQTKGKQKANNTPSTPSSTVIRTVEYEAPSSLADVAREVNAMHTTSFNPINAQQSPGRQSPYFASSFPPVNRDVPASKSAPGGPNASRASSSAAPSGLKPIIKHEEPRRPPANKEEAARKRTFGDLVDLTTQDDSDDDIPPPKKIMTNAPTAQPATGTTTQQRDPLSYLQKPATFHDYMAPNTNKNGHGAAQQANDYQPQAPSQRPAVPSQPVQPPPKQKGPTSAQLQQSRMKGKLLVEPIMRDRAARKTVYDSRTIARDVLLATGRHPDMRGLNSHLTVMQKLLGQHGLDSDGGNRSDLATIRWDVIDPEPAKKTAKDDNGVNESDGQIDGASHSLIKSRPQPPSPQFLSKPRKKLGRPYTYRISPDPTVDPALLGATPNASTSKDRSGHASPSTSNPTTPTATLDMAGAGAAVGYSAFQQVGADGKKKKGRPFGWRKSVHSREAQGLEKFKNPYRKPASRPIGRPPVQHNASQPVAPEYQVFPCAWVDCKSELHNADVLKKHVVKVHGRADDYGDLYCRWEGCEVMERRWGGFQAWLQHVDNVHLEPIRWKLGDGPREVDPFTLRESSQIPRYLTDAYGRSVTPVISPPTPPPLNVPPDEGNTTDLRDPLQTADAQQRSAMPDHPVAEPFFDAELRELQEAQRTVGPTMGRMGCVFASEARRIGFLDDEDFEDEVVGSEHDIADEEEDGV